MLSANLTFPVPCISERYIKMKINLKFYFHSSLWCLKKGFMKDFRAFIKPFEAPQKRVKKFK